MNQTELRQCLDSYLAVKDALGFKTQPARILLRDFLHFVESRSISEPIRAQTAIDWACDASSTCGASGQVQRLSVVRGFLSFLCAIEPETEVPDHNLLARSRRPTPYLFTPAQITQLLDEASRMKPAGSLRPHLWQALIGLLASAGLRVGEAIRLKINDLKLEDDPPFLQVLETKYRKSRLVPLHPTTAMQLRRYVEKRRQLRYDVRSDHFFISEKGNPLDQVALWRTFKRITQRLGMHPTDGSRRPSLHSLRHSFAVERLRQWYRAGMDVHALIPHLSVYLGHVRLQDSYWYLTATPELLSATGERFQQYAGGEQ
jgi:site-specific recombinase XerD